MAGKRRSSRKSEKVSVEEKVSSVVESMDRNKEIQEDDRNVWKRQEQNESMESDEASVHKNKVEETGDISNEPAKSKDTETDVQIVSNDDDQVGCFVQEESEKKKTDHEDAIDRTKETEVVKDIDKDQADVTEDENMSKGKEEVNDTVEGEEDVDDDKEVVEKEVDIELGEQGDDGVDEEDDDDDDDEEEEGWDLKHIHTIEEIESEKFKCMTRKCPLTACCTYVSSIDSSNIWYSCIDCQEKDYGGWPTEIGEIPLKFMTEEHREVISEKCTGRYSPDMPQLPTVDPSKLDSPTITQPQRTKLGNDLGSQSKTSSVVHHVSTVTPPPGKQNSSRSMVLASTTDGKSKKVTPIPTKPSNQALAVHKKWQDAAKALGGERIIVSKPAAKKLILDFLKDAFKPMNITDIFKSLKGVVPSPVLKSSLDDMALDAFNPQDQFAESDDEEDGISTKKKGSKIGSSDDEYAGSLSIKLGRNANTTLYYCDYSKFSNNGNGLLPDDRNTLLSDHETSKAELKVLNNSISSMSAETLKLLSEPTNEDATSALEQAEEYSKILWENVDAAKELKSLAKERTKTKKRIDTMAAEWRKRRRLCMEFLLAMEDNTDGTISVKKCLSGDGQIYIESDSTAIKGQKEFAINKKRRNPMSTQSRKKQKVNDKSGPLADESFIGVELNARGFVDRIYLEES